MLHRKNGLIRLKKQNLRSILILQDEQFIWRNARLDGGGFHFGILFTYKADRLQGNIFTLLVLEELVKWLLTYCHRLVANVTIIARSDEQLGEAASHGYNAEQLTDDFEVARRLSCQYNSRTVAFRCKAI